MLIKEDLFNSVLLNLGGSHPGYGKVNLTRPLAHVGNLISVAEFASHIDKTHEISYSYSEFGLTHYY